ncbi:prostaglandin reductase 2-like [Littorina saxatilis]|uniref:prostaglandin reductase 2-like n=1 Tax=Littorina saxatilis TaxID=31220 RepID=UPI0038B60011
METLLNKRVILKSRPGVNGEPSEDNFGVEECEMPSPASLSPGQVLVKNLYLSVDPALRCRMNEDSGVHYMSAWQLGQPIDGLGGVGEVEASADSTFTKGDRVSATFLWPWAAFFVIDGKHVKKMPKELFGSEPSLALSLLGGTGLTAYLGVAEKGHVTPGSGQTVVVSAAAGATGSLAGQVARLLGAERVVGICGSAAKCQFLEQELGFDAAVNYKSGDVSAQLSKACPDGVHVYFDNVGGDLSERVIEQMVPNGHVILCGQIAVYNKDLPYPPPISPTLQQLIQDRNITRERFLVLDYSDKFDEALAVLSQWYLAGKIKVKETVAEGVENTGKAFVSMMKGGNVGKQIVKVHNS